MAGWGTTTAPNWGYAAPAAPAPAAAPNYNYAPGSPQYLALQQALQAKYGQPAAAPAPAAAAPAANYNFAPGSDQYVALQQALTAKYGGTANPNVDAYGRWQNAPGAPFQLQPASAGGLNAANASDPAFEKVLQNEAYQIMATPGNHLSTGSNGTYQPFGPFSTSNPVYSGRWGPTWYPSDGTPLPTPDKWEIDPFTGLPHDPRSGGSITPSEWAINDANPASVNYNPKLFGAGGAGQPASTYQPPANQAPDAAAYPYGSGFYSQPGTTGSSGGYSYGGSTAQPGGWAGGSGTAGAAAPATPAAAPAGLPPASTATAPVTSPVTPPVSSSMPPPPAASSAPPQDPGTVPSMGLPGGTGTSGTTGTTGLANQLAGGPAGGTDVPTQSQQDLLAKKLAAQQNGWQAAGWTSQPT